MLAGAAGLGDLVEQAGRAEKAVEAWRVGRVYVEFSREDSCCRAAHMLHGRQYAGKTVACGYLPLRQYQRKFGKGLRPRTHEEKQEAALAVQAHLTAHIPDF